MTRFSVRPLVLIAGCLFNVAAHAQAQERSTKWDPDKVRDALHFREAKQRFQQRVQKCWQLPPGVREGRTSIEIRVKLKPDGTVDSASPLTEPKDKFSQTLVRSGIDAITQCQPYAFPVTEYKFWKEVILVFDAEYFKPKHRP